MELQLDGGWFMSQGPALLSFAILSLHLHLGGGSSLLTLFSHSALVKRSPLTGVFDLFFLEHGNHLANLTDAAKSQEVKGISLPVPKDQSGVIPPVPRDQSGVIPTCLHIVYM